MRNFLRPPVFPDDDQTYAARLLYVILLAFGVTSLLAAALSLWLGPSAQRFVLLAAGVMVTSGVLLVLARRGFTHLASWGLIGALWGMATADAFTNGGVRAPTFTGHLIIILAAGLLLTTRAGVAVAAGSLLVGLGFALAETRGWLPTPVVSDSLSLWLAYVFLISMVIALLHLSRGTVVEALARARQEVAERRRAEAALRELEALYRRAIEAVGAVPYYRDNATDTYTFMGEGIQALVGYPASEFTPELWDTLTLKGQLRGESAQYEWDEALRQARTGRLTIWQCDWQIRTRTGQTRWLADATVEVLDAAGELRGTIGILQDITDRKQAEATLRESEALYRRAIEAAGAVPYYRDYDAKTYPFMGEGIRQLTGYGPADMTATLWNSMLVETQLGGEAAQYEFDEALRRVRTGELAIWKCDYLIRARNGQLRWIADSAVEVLDEQRVSHGSIGILQDVTDRRRALEQTQRLNVELEQRVAERTEALSASEARFRAMSEASPLGVFVDDADGQCVYVNAAYQAITGLSIQVAWGQGWTQFIHPDDADRVNATWEAAVRQSDFHYEVVYRLRHPLGREVWVSVKAAPMRASATLLGYVGTLEDITERKRAEEALRQRTAELEAAVAELEAFSYSVSHDLRAPLRAVDGFSRLLRSDYAVSLPPEAQRYLNRVSEGAQRMGQLIDDLLAFSRLGRQALRFQSLASTELSALVQAAADELQAERSGRVVKVTIGDLPNCWADPALLKQVFVNLLSNAFKFTQTQPLAHVEIGSTRAADGATYRVRDNGVGFDMRYTSKLFGVFQRLHSENEFEGTGVGLAIAQRIVQKHGGHIWAVAEVGKGATFYFTLSPNH